MEDKEVFVVVVDYRIDGEGDGVDIEIFDTFEKAEKYLLNQKRDIITDFEYDDINFDIKERKGKISRWIEIEDEDKTNSYVLELYKREIK